MASMASLSSEAIISAISPMRVSIPVATTTPCTRCGGRLAGAGMNK